MLWSKQDDDQLIGRLWRMPQPKMVHVYRIIAARTPDVFLNNISFDKGTMQEAFTGSSTVMSKFGVLRLLYAILTIIARGSLWK